MRCEEVQEQLSEYLEKLLDPAQSRSIDGHLASCLRCTGELAELAECRRLVAALPMVEPPVGFTTRVMAHIREGVEKTSLWERLFLSMRAKLPLSATALLVVGVMSVYLLQKEKPQENLVPSLALQQSENKSLKLARETKRMSDPGEELRSDPVAKALAPETPRLPLQDRPAQEPVAAAKQSPNARSAATGIRADRKARAEAPAPPPLANEERAKQVDSTTAEAELPPTPSRPISGAIGVSSQPAGGHATGGSPSLEAILQERAMRAPLAERARSASPSPLQSNADIEIVIRRHPQPANEHRDGAEPPRKDTERKLGTPSISGLSAPRSVAAPAQNDPIVRTIPADQYDQFKKELATQGTIVSEARMGTRDNDGQALANQTLTIKVTVLPAEAAR